MKSINNIYIFLAAIISTLPYTFLQYFELIELFIPVIETFVVFLAFLFLHKEIKAKFYSIYWSFSLWYLLIKIGLSTTYSGVDFFSFTYTFLTGLVWMNLAARGMKSNDKLKWVLWLIVGICVNVVATLLYQV